MILSAVQNNSGDDPKVVPHAISLPSLPAVKPNPDGLKGASQVRMTPPTQGDKLDGLQKQIQADLKVFQSDTAHPDERGVARKRLLEAGLPAFEAIKAELPTARGDKRNDLLRLRADIGTAEARKFGNEFVELDFEMTPERLGRMKSMLEARLPQLATRLGEHSLSTQEVKTKDAREVFNLMVEGLKNSKDVVGAPRTNTTTDRGSVTESFTVDLKDGRSVTLEYCYSKVKDDREKVIGERFDSVGYKIEQKGKEGNQDGDKVKQSGSLFHVFRGN